MTPSPPGAYDAAMRLAPRLALAAFAALGCGPNYRYVYDGEGAFERCYALDFDVDIAPAARNECWANWLQAYAYGSTSDRVEYARGRLSSLSREGDAGARSAPPSPMAEPAARPAAVETRAAPAILEPDAGEVPLRSSVMSATLDAGPARDAQPSTLVAPPPTARPQGSNLGEPPGARCGGDCRTQWSACGERCTARDAACVAQCDEGYRECMRGCF